MADYFPLLSRAISALPDSTPEARRAVYDRARNALLGQLRTIQPPMEESAIAVESDALDEAIARLEREAEPIAESVPPSPAPTREALKPEAEKPEPAKPESAKLEPAPPESAKPEPSRPQPTQPEPPLQQSARPIPPARTPLRPIPPMPPVRPNASAPQGLPPAAMPDSMPKPPAPAQTAAPGPQNTAAPERFIPAEDADGGGEPAVAIRAPGFRGDPGAAARDNARPVVPSAPHTTGLDRRLVWVGLALLICVGLGALAFSLRVPPEDFARPRPQTVDRESSKSGQRAGEAGEAAQPSAPASPSQAGSQSPSQTGSQAPARVETGQRAAPPQQAVAPSAPISQRAALLVQAAVNDQQNITTHVGATLWRLVPSQRPGANGQPAIRGDVDLPEIRLRLTLTIEKNTDSTLRASHTMTIRFASEAGGNFPAVAEIGAPQMRNENTPAVDPLAGVQAKITENIFIIALTGEPAFAARNIETMKTRGWFDFPLRMADGRIAKITLEKGVVGDRLFEEAFEAWK